MNRLQQLHEAGVSIWLDTLSRDLLDRGAFATLLSGAVGKNGVFGDAHGVMRQMRTEPGGPVGALSDWRRRRLIAAGFDAPLATQLADDGTIDLHELLVLLDRGCPPALAARILAPIDLPGRRC